jgi:hypothetical protein
MEANGHANLMILNILGDLAAGDECARRSGVIFSNKLDGCLLVGFGGCCEREGFDGPTMTTTAYIRFVIN